MEPIEDNNALFDVVLKNIPGLNEHKPEAVIQACIWLSGFIGGLASPFLMHSNSTYEKLLSECMYTMRRTSKMVVARAKTHAPDVGGTVQ